MYLKKLALCNSTKIGIKGGPKVPSQLHKVHLGQNNYRRAHEERTRYLLLF